MQERWRGTYGRRDDFESCHGEQNVKIRDDGSVVVVQLIVSASIVMDFHGRITCLGSVFSNSFRASAR